MIQKPNLAAQRLESAGAAGAGPPRAFAPRARQRWRHHHRIRDGCIRRRTCRRRNRDEPRLPAEEHFLRAPTRPVLSGQAHRGPDAFGICDAAAVREGTAGNEKPQPGEAGRGSCLDRNFSPMLLFPPCFAWSVGYQAPKPGPNFRFRPTLTTLTVSLKLGLAVKTTAPHPGAVHTKAVELLLLNW